MKLAMAVLCLILLTSCSVPVPKFQTFQVCYDDSDRRVCSPVTWCDPYDLRIWQLPNVVVRDGHGEIVNPPDEEE